MDDATRAALRNSETLMALLQALFVEMLQSRMLDLAAAGRILQMADEITQRQPDGGLRAAEFIGSFRQLAELIERNR